MGRSGRSRQVVRPWVGLSLLLTGVTLLVSGCSGGASTLAEGLPPAPGISHEGQKLVTDHGRQGAQVLASGGQAAPYNYGPALIADGGGYRAWWCSQLPGAGADGDDILSAAGPALDKPFGPAQPVFSGTGTGFDAMHTCDPSVIKVRGSYYLYYTGAAADHDHINGIGVASSTDGVSWTRLADSKPILTSSREVNRANTYGAGQPSVVYRDGWFYLLFTDTAGKAAGWDGAGQFVVRAKDPAFRQNFQAWGDKGFTDADPAKASRSRMVVNAFSADLMWVDALDAWAIAHETAEGTTVGFWSVDFQRRPFQDVLIPGQWKEGPGLVRRADGHAPASLTDPCGRVPLDVVRATVLGAAPTDLRWFGIDVVGAKGCLDDKRAAAVLDGLAMPSADRTIDLIASGTRMRVERRSVALALGNGLLGAPVDAVAGLSRGGNLKAGALAVRAPDRPVGIVLEDGHLYVVGDPQVAELNSSGIREVTQHEWDSYPRGTDLTRR
ncbi:beta-xylosidase [Pseudonocardiaceae bacterium YIM PH 21723]|nr:beta-xylosidase [Pseudonocardiaceae bacterium YIM PH 21723]